MESSVRLFRYRSKIKNLLEHHLSQCQELTGTDENIMEGPNPTLRTDLLGQGPIGHVILLLNVKVASS
jgi:hypothetical protein